MYTLFGSARKSALRSQRVKKILIRENLGSQHVYEFSEKDFIKNTKTDKVILNDFISSFKVIP